MNKFSATFQKGPAYIGYLTAGDGGMEASFNYFMALMKGGVDILEIGIPFSDPVADGPIIQAAANRALKSGTTITDVLNLVQRLREYTQIPIILFSYYNPIFIASQKEDFFLAAKKAGVDGCLIVDIPLEESYDYSLNCVRNQIEPILVISPSTPDERIKKIADHSNAMLYYACRKGTTGVRNELPDDVVAKLAMIKSHTQVPVVAGFGISNQKMAKTIIQHADGFVVGSLFVEATAAGISPEELIKLAQSIDPRHRQNVFKKSTALI